jgi:hypothetical protein
MSTVTLTEDDFGKARLIALRRNEWASMNAEQSTWGGTYRHPLEIDILGTCGEMALMRFLGSSSVPTYDPALRKNPDVGPFDVRTTAVSAGCLIMRQRDAVDRYHVLVVQLDRLRYRIAGYCHGSIRHSKEIHQYERGDPIAWFIPQAKLLPAEELHDLYMDAQLEAYLADLGREARDGQAVSE